MNSLVLFYVAAALPALLALVLGINTVLLFVAVASGVLLEQVFYDDAVLVVSGFMSTNPELVTRISLYVLPVLAVLLLLRKSSKPSKLLAQIVPIVLTSLMFAILLLGRIGGDFATAVYATPVGDTVRHFGDIIVTLAIVLNILTAWQLYRHKHEEKHGKKHH